MFEDLRAAIQTAPLRPDPAELREWMALCDVAKSRLAEAVGEFDSLDMAELDGATSTTAWLRHNGRMTGREAQRLAVIGRSLTKLPAHAEALREGRISWGQVEVVLSTLGQRLIDHLVDIDTELAGWLEPLDMEATAVLAQRIRALFDGSPEPDEEADRLHLSTTFAGRGVGDFEYGAESMAILNAAINAAMTKDIEGEPARSPATRRADALIDIAKSFLDHRDDVPGRRNRPHVNIVIDAKDLAGGGSGFVLESGDILPRSSVEAFLCDCSMSRVLKSGSTLLDYGTSTRTIANGLWSALVIRDRHCRFPGCDRPATWCDGHHVRWFSQGGATALDNLVLLCRRHHRILHKPGWSARLCPDASLEVTDPWGGVRVSHPPWWVPRLELA